IRHRLMKFLYEKNGNTDGIKNESEVSLIFKCKRANEITKYLSRINKKWKLPTTVITSKSFLWLVIVFVLWGIVVFSFFKMNPEFFIVTFDVLSLSFLLLIMLLPELLLRFLFPRIFGVEKYINVKTFGDLVGELNRLNQFDYLSDNYGRIREDMFNLYGPF